MAAWPEPPVLKKFTPLGYAEYQSELKLFCLRLQPLYKPQYVHEVLHRYLTAVVDPSTSVGVWFAAKLPEVRRSVLLGLSAAGRAAVTSVHNALDQYRDQLLAAVRAEVDARPDFESLESYESLQHDATQLPSEFMRGMQHLYVQSTMVRDRYTAVQHVQHVLSRLHPTISEAVLAHACMHVDLSAAPLGALEPVADRVWANSMRVGVV